MKVLKAKVNWYKKYTNLPVLELLVDVLPDLDELQFEHKNGIYYAELDGYVQFFYYRSPGQGFGGAVYALTMKDGTTKELRGPWSSNCSAVNGLGFGPCVEVSLTKDVKAYERGWTFFAGSCTLALAIEAAKLAKVELVKVIDSYSCLDLGGEQVHAIGGKDIILPLSTEIPPDVDWTVAPSLSKDSLVKES